MRLSLFITLLAFIFNAGAESNSKGPNSPIVVGKITNVSSDKVEVQTKGHLRKLTLNNKSQIIYVSFLGKPQELKPGLPVKAKVTNQVIKSIYVTLPVPYLIKRTPEMSRMSAKELFTKTDSDQNGEISYVEFSRTIYNSPKHGPDNFIKTDKDKSGTFNLDEFTSKLASINWWRIGQKTPQEWLTLSDENKDGLLSIKEFALINGGPGHIEQKFKKVDKDKSGNADLKEVTVYIKTMIEGK